MKDTYVKIDLDAVYNNAREIIKKYNKYKYYIGVVKSDAYGHGKYIVNELIRGGINYLAVSYMNEALDIRKYNKDVTILCLQPISISDVNKAAKENITITVHDYEYFKELNNIKLKGNLKIHLKIDTGMNRLGLKSSVEVKEIYDAINSNKNMTLEGIYTHFATAGIFDKHYDNQLSRFKEITSLIDLNKIPIVHLNNSVSLITHPKESFTTGTRIGILMYGYNVSYQIASNGIKNKLRLARNSYYQNRYSISKTYSNVKINVLPAISMVTGIIQIKEVKQGEYIGYGATYLANEDMLIAILPVGYANGIGKSRGRFVIINGKKYYVVGEVGMNMMSIRIDKDVTLDSEVWILGNGITLGMFSRFDGSSLSEVLLNVGRNNKKVYYKDGKLEHTEESR